MTKIRFQRPGSISWQQKWLETKHHIITIHRIPMQLAEPMITMTNDKNSQIVNPPLTSRKITSSTIFSPQTHTMHKDNKPSPRMPPLSHTQCIGLFNSTRRQNRTSCIGNFAIKALEGLGFDKKLITWKELRKWVPCGWERAIGEAIVGIPRDSSCPWDATARTKCGSVVVSIASCLRFYTAKVVSFVPAWSSKGLVGALTSTSSKLDYFLNTMVYAFSCDHNAAWLIDTFQ
jgi:hypothetical protein